MELRELDDTAAFIAATKSLLVFVQQRYRALYFEVRAAERKGRSGVVTLEGRAGWVNIVVALDLTAHADKRPAVIRLRTDRSSHGIKIHAGSQAVDLTFRNEPDDVVELGLASRARLPKEFANMGEVAEAIDHAMLSVFRWASQLQMTVKWRDGPLPVPVTPKRRTKAGAKSAQVSAHAASAVDASVDASGWRGPDLEID